MMPILPFPRPASRHLSSRPQTSKQGTRSKSLAFLSGLTTRISRSVFAPRSRLDASPSRDCWRVKSQRPSGSTAMLFCNCARLGQPAALCNDDSSKFQAAFEDCASADVSLRRSLRFRRISSIISRDEKERERERERTGLPRVTRLCGQK